MITPTIFWGFRQQAGLHQSFLSCQWPGLSFTAMNNIFVFYAKAKISYEASTLWKLSGHHSDSHYKVKKFLILNVLILDIRNSQVNETVLYFFPEKQIQIGYTYLFTLLLFSVCQSCSGFMLFHKPIDSLQICKGQKLTYTTHIA